MGAGPEDGGGGCWVERDPASWPHPAVCPLLRCRQTPQGSTSLPAAPTRTSPFLTFPQASAWLPCLATQVSIALLLSH